MLDYSRFKEQSIKGRYINKDSIRDCFKKVPSPLIHIGDSVRGNPIHAFTMGDGGKKILMFALHAMWNVRGCPFFENRFQL